MPKYKVTRYSEHEEVWYIHAESEEEALHTASTTDPSEMGLIGNSETEIEIDDSLDEAEESDLKERTWNNDLN